MDSISFIFPYFSYFIFRSFSSFLKLELLGTGSTRERAGGLVIVSHVYKGDLPPVEWSMLFSPLLVLQP